MSNISFAARECSHALRSPYCPRRGTRLFFGFSFYGRKIEFSGGIFKVFGKHISFHSGRSWVLVTFRGNCIAENWILKPCSSSRKSFQLDLPFKRTRWDSWCLDAEILQRFQKSNFTMIPVWMVSTLIWYWGRNSQSGCGCLSSFFFYLFSRVCHLNLPACHSWKFKILTVAVFGLCLQRCPLLVL